MSNVGQQLLSGAVSGFATTVVLQPFDLLKTRLQQGDGSLNRPVLNSHTIFNTTKQIVSTQGWLGLWRGTTPSLLRNVPGVALYMTSLTQLRSFLAKSPQFASMQKRVVNEGNSSVLPTLTSQGNLIAGATTRVAIGFLLNPFSVLKARFESNMYTYQTMSGAFVSIVRQGPPELFRGFFASSLRDAPYAGLFMVFYEGIKSKASVIAPSQNKAQASLLHSFAAASAGGIATLLTHPFDVIKTKMQVRSEDRYHGFSTTVRTIWKQRGVSGFFDGGSLRLSRKVLSSAIGWAVYEAGLMFMKASGSKIR